MDDVAELLKFAERGGFIDFATGEEFTAAEFRRWLESPPLEQVVPPPPEKSS